MGYLVGQVMMGSSCDQKGARYVDPNTGTGLNLVNGDSTGLLVDAATGEPVEMYVDQQINDTIYGATGDVINGRISRGDNGRYVYQYDEDNNAAKRDFNSGSASGYVPGSEPNEVKRKSPGYKYKGGKGEYRIKRPGYKKEVEKDGDVTIKTRGKKIKIDGETGERKVKYD
ncbi:MAG: hypothetical protein JWP69_1859 [Flaviaesturariibacter sp.]|nr:hypothetical protein [Flaviaesturariibacter sp.]